MFKRTLLALLLSTASFANARNTTRSSYGSCQAFFACYELTGTGFADSANKNEFCRERSARYQEGSCPAENTSGCRVNKGQDSEFVYTLPMKELVQMYCEEVGGIEEVRP